MNRNDSILARFAASDRRRGSCPERGTQAPNRKRLFDNVLEALHDSRRSQAAREIHRYQFLVREAREYDARRKLKSQRPKHGEDAMPINLSPVSNSMDRRPTPQSPMSFKLRLLMAAALVGFGILHLIGSAMMLSASSKPPIETATLTHNGD